MTEIDPQALKEAEAFDVHYWRGWGDAVADAAIQAQREGFEHLCLVHLVGFTDACIPCGPAHDE